MIIVIIANIPQTTGDDKVPKSMHFDFAHARDCAYIIATPKREKRGDGIKYMWGTLQKSQLSCPCCELQQVAASGDGDMQLMQLSRQASYNVCKMFPTLHYAVLVNENSAHVILIQSHFLQEINQLNKKRLPTSSTLLAELFWIILFWETLCYRIHWWRQWGKLPYITARWKAISPTCWS